MSSSSLSQTGSNGPLATQHDGARQVVVDHQGAGRIVHRPDGSIVWEALPERSGQSPNMLHQIGRAALSCAEVAVHVTLAVGGITGVISTVQHVEKAYDHNMCLTSRQLTQNVANTVAGAVAGTLTGVVLGPVHVARALGVRLVRPVLLAAAVTHGLQWLSRHRAGVADILKKLQSGVLSQQLEALRAVIMRAAQSAAFRREFHKLAGVEVLLKHLQDALALAEATGMDSPLLHLLAQALAQLVAQDNQCKEAVVAAGGVPLLVQLLGVAHNPVVTQGAMTTLAALAEHPLAQDAMRDAGAASKFLELAAAPPRGVSPHVRTEALSLLTAMALDPAGKVAVGQAGGVSTLLGLVKSTTPRSALQAQAVVALHAVVRGAEVNQRALAEAGSGDEAAATLRAALTAAGPHWSAHKADLHALLNVLARRKAISDAVAAPSAAPSPSPSPTAGSPRSAGPEAGWVDANDA